MYADAVQGLEAKQAALLLSTQGLTNAQIQQTLTAKGLTVEEQYQAMVEAGLLKSKQTMTNVELQNNIAKMLSAQMSETEANAKAREVMSSMKLSVAMEGESAQTIKLTTRKLQLAVQSGNLTKAQAQELAMHNGITLTMKAQAASTLPKWIAMLQAATKAVWGQVKATAVWMATNPIGWATAAIAAIGAVTLGLNKYAKASKEASDKAQEGYEKSKERTQSNKEEAKSLDELIRKYEELKSASDMDSDTRSEIKELQYDIMELVGAEVQNLDLVNGALDEELAKLKEIAAEKARQNAEDAKDNYYQSRQTAEKLAGNYDDYGNDASISAAELYELFDIAYDTSKGRYIDAEGKAVQWADILHTFTEQFGDIVRDSENPFSRDIVVDTNGITNIEDRIKRLEELKEFIGDMGLRKSDLYTSVTDSIAYYEDQYSNELEAASTLTESLIDDLYFSNEKLAGITVDSVVAFEQYRETMISEMKSDETIGEAMADGILSDEAIEKAVNDFMATADQFSDWYEQWKMSVEGDTVVPDTKVSLSISDTVSQLNTQLKPAFDSLKSAYQSIFTSDGYNPNAVDIPMLDSIKSSIEEINKLEDVDITIDMDAFDTLATTLTDVNTTEDLAKQAFNDFATSIFYTTNATDGMTEETKELVEQLLESLGIVNATEVAEYALAEAKAKDMLATYDLAMASAENEAAKVNEFHAILAEGEAAGITRQQIYSLTAAEIAFGNNNLNTEGKIAQLRNLAKAYGDTASAALATAIANDLASGHTDTDTAINNLTAQINTGIQKVDIDFSPIEKSASNAGSSAGKSYADALKDELSNLNSVINYIGDVIDDQIDLFEDQKDAAVDALEAEKEAAEEALEAEKELAQEKIDAKQAEVDAIEEAAKARKNELDLQQKQYDLERMQNQKTMLVNSMPDTIVI